jgi:hypothetical protein
MEDEAEKQRTLRARQKGDIIIKTRRAIVCTRVEEQTEVIENNNNRTIVAANITQFHLEAHTPLLCPWTKAQYFII